LKALGQVDDVRNNWLRTDLEGCNLEKKYVRQILDENG
jgi:hypothetical protein